MWGELLLGLLSAAAESANNDADNETKRVESETKRVESQYQLAIEQERTRQQKEATKRDILNSVIGGVFNVLVSCVDSNSNTESDTEKKQ